MPIPNDNPVTVPSATFNLWWVTSLQIDSTKPNEKTSATATLSLARQDVDGRIIFFDKDKTRLLYIPDIFALAGTDPAVASLINSIITLVGTIAKEQGII